MILLGDPLDYITPANKKKEEKLGKMLRKDQAACQEEIKLAHDPNEIKKQQYDEAA